MRARLRHAAFTHAPVWLSRGRLAHAPSQRPLHAVRRSIYLPDLPGALDGMRITHLSDLHIGKLTTPAYLPHVVEACHKEAGDLVAVTGDFVDLTLDVLDEVIAALLQIRAPLGVHLVMGNHDYLDDGQELIRRFRMAGLGLLLNESADIRHNGCRINVSGIDYDHRPAALARMVHRTVGQVRRSHQPDLSLLLAHHPDAFDYACRHNVDLTLSGHTHGGQFVLSNNLGRKGSIGLGSLAFRYPRGLYQRGGCHLYVNSGVGSWFPLRVNCPAEIACLTLRCQPAGPVSADPSQPLS